VSTPIFGVRVLDVAPDELRVRVCVLSVYWDQEPDGRVVFEPSPCDASFFLRILWPKDQYPNLMTSAR
jgi:hypothetical protein